MSSEPAQVTLPEGVTPLLTTVQLAAALQVPVQTIYDWRVHGRGPKGARVGKHVRFAWSDVQAWLEAKAS